MALRDNVRQATDIALAATGIPRRRNEAMMSGSVGAPGAAIVNASAMANEALLSNALTIEDSNGINKL